MAFEAVACEPTFDWDLLADTVPNHFEHQTEASDLQQDLEIQCDVAQVAVEDFLTMGLQ